MCHELEIFEVICMYRGAGLDLLVFMIVILELLPCMILLLGNIIIIITINFTFHVIERSNQFFSLSISPCLSVSSSRTL